MKKMTSTVASGLLLTAGMFASFPSVSPVFAQQQPPVQQQPNQQTIGEPELRSFAKAYLEVEKVRDSYGSQMNQNSDAAAQKAIEQEAVTKIHAIINKEGLSPDTYNRIVQTANADEGLRAKVIELIEQERSKPQ